MTVSISINHIERNIILTANNKQFNTQALSASEQALLLKKFDLFIKDQLAISDIKSEHFNSLVQDVNDAIRSKIKKSKDIHFELQGQGFGAQTLTISKEKWSELKKLCQAVNDYTDKKRIKYRGTMIASAVFTPITIAGTALYYTLGVPALIQLLNASSASASAYAAANTVGLVLVSCMLALLITATVAGHLICSSCSFTSLERQRTLLDNTSNDGRAIVGAPAQSNNQTDKATIVVGIKVN